MNTGPLHGQVAIVTGAGNGIGAAIARALAAAGAATAVVDRDGAAARETLAQIEREGGRGVVVRADVTDVASVEAMLATVTTELGRPDLLVNNVGGSRSVAPVATSDPDRWLADVQLNLVSTYLCSRAVLPSMIERERGRIINIASNGAVGAWPYLSAYAASKAGVVSLTSTLAQEVRAHGIIVFALHPGHVGTRLVEHLAQQLAPYQRGNGEHAQLSSPDAAARLCVFLASGAADQFSGHFFADATDTPRRFLWRTIARLGMIRRDMASLGVTRRLSREAGPDGSVHPAARRAGLRFTDSLRRLVTVLAVGLTRVEIEHGILVLGHL